MAVYLLHFSEPFGHAKHYIGWTPDRLLDKRIKKHRNGTGGRLCAKAVEVGITLTLARVWENGDRALERQLKGWHGAAKLCPICKGARHEMVEP